MGNVFQIQFGDALIDRCWDCIAGQVLYLCQFEDYLQDLETARDKLQELMNDVMRMVISEETPQTVKLDREGGWLSWVDATIIEVNALLNRATQERQKLCIASYCSENYKSSYMFGKSVCRSFKHVVALMSEGEFKEMVIRAPAVQLQADLEALRTAKQELWALKEDVKRKITLEEGQQKKALQQVQLWVSMAEAIITEAEELGRDGTQQIQKLLEGYIFNYMFVGRVAKKLEDVIAVKDKGDFKEVVEWALPEPVVIRNFKPTVGTETTLDEAWSCLMGDQVEILSMYGMGGVGKTTILTQINHRFAFALNDFDVVIWVIVFKDLSLRRLIADLKKNDFFDEKWEKKSIGKKEDIFHVLSGKKFVLLLDDIWQRVELGEIGVALATRKNRCKIVFTTCSHRVGRQMEAEKMIKVNRFDWEEAWALFKEKLGILILILFLLLRLLLRSVKGCQSHLLTLIEPCPVELQWKNGSMLLRY
ncbi:hypothetical protein P3X46_022624 [Hevea brasiliensis]|uniref:NB-ARC domain-containing protein n=1 Tax=Hevea brasiliensis TaxID=3981 RepID=A0ABQ9LB25_HEVBR|nr:probable disease resistance protein At1g15890 [Hevea brasiliensis]XP_057988000.1 probable disease resistance protein At1g15890 [Hevea brasiliensis]XP_057988001.1 probable disease resistance protein At1g15890 [Hevea brasiliensis]XP_057988002.1 probable disease resistance protein At1g15890 [Hevea brasiliensis]KAJ9162884.1 hypothetical protein P3X46_022624 [Hevea brasiliensis]